MSIFLRFLLPFQQQHTVAKRMIDLSVGRGISCFMFRLKIISYKFNEFNTN